MPAGPASVPALADAVAVAVGVRVGVRVGVEVGGAGVGVNVAAAVAGGGVAVGASGVAVGGSGVAVGGAAVAVGGAGVVVGGSGVRVGGATVGRGASGVAVGAARIAAGSGVAVRPANACRAKTPVPVRGIVDAVASAVGVAGRPSTTAYAVAGFTATAGDCRRAAAPDTSAPAKIPWITLVSVRLWLVDTGVAAPRPVISSKVMATPMTPSRTRTRNAEARQLRRLPLRSLA
jgi:hypothetical protein